MNPANKMQNVQHEIPLLVDLDGSLINTDTLYETAILFIKKKPLHFLLVFLWLVKGKHILKKELSQRNQLSVDSLPYRREVLDYLEGQHQAGRNIILCTGSWIGIADRVADKFSFIDSVIATDSVKNLTGSTKLAYVKNRWERGKFDYLGNEEIDLLIWKEARKAIVVGDKKLAALAAQSTELEKHFHVESASIKSWLKALRIHQWAKNALLFVPLLTAQKMLHIESVVSVIVAFFCFSVIASATYLINDLLDLESDRKHRIKKNRPLAAGLIGIPQAVVSSFLLICLGVLLATLFLNNYFLLSLFFYLILTVLYSFKLKSLQTVDVIALASLFTVRIIAGGAAIEVSLSFWLLCFSMFVFLSLAMVKRVSELISTEKNNSFTLDKISGRGYFTADIVILQCLGGASGFISVLVFALYINSVEVTKLYNHPEILWLICPILGYWIMRVWMLVARDEMDEDPISFAITDRNSWLAAFLILCVVYSANYF